MSDIKLFTNSTCDELLNYKINPNLRKLYNADSFNYDGIKYLSDSIRIDLEHNDVILGTKPSDDMENSIKIFSCLKNLDLVQANDRRLWVTLNHTVFYNYAKTRWAISELSSNEVIKDRFHFEGSGLRARNQNSIARLWWGAKITYDESRADPFELTKLLWERQDFYQNLIDRKLSTYSCILKGFIEFYSLNKQIDLKFEMRKLIKGINAYGGVRLLPLLGENEVKEQIFKLCKFYNIKANAA